MIERFLAELALVQQFDGQIVGRLFARVAEFGRAARIGCVDDLLLAAPLKRATRLDRPGILCAPESTDRHDRDLSFSLR